MKKFVMIFLLIVIAPMYFSRASDTPVGLWSPNVPSPFKTPPVMSELLKNYRQTWIRLTELEPSGLHWNQRVMVYINQHDDVYRSNHAVYRKSLAGEDEDEAQPFTPYPYGTVLLKENYVMDGQGSLKPASITIMMKYEKDYDPTMGDWHFVQFDPSGNMIVNGSSQNPGVKVLCASCHENIAERDYIFSTLHMPPKDSQ